MPLSALGKKFVKPDGDIDLKALRERIKETKQEYLVLFETIRKMQESLEFLKEYFWARMIIIEERFEGFYWDGSDELEVVSFDNRKQQIRKLWDTKLYREGSEMAWYYHVASITNNCFKCGKVIMFEDFVLHHKKYIPKHLLTRGTVPSCKECHEKLNDT